MTGICFAANTAGHGHSSRALADPARWRLVELLAERPCPVGVLAQLAGARQPQTTKHLQTLERAGVVSSERSGNRRIYTLRSEPLRELAAALLRARRHRR